MPLGVGFRWPGPSRTSSHPFRWRGGMHGPQARDLASQPSHLPTKRVEFGFLLLDDRLLCGEPFFPLLAVLRQTRRHRRLAPLSGAEPNPNKQKQQTRNKAGLPPAIHPAAPALSRRLTHRNSPSSSSLSGGQPMGLTLPRTDRQGVPASVSNGPSHASAGGRESRESD